MDKNFEDTIKKLQPGESNVTISDVTIKDISFKDAEKCTQLYKAIEDAVELEKLIITNCKFDDDSLNTLLITLAKCPTLSWLYFTKNDIGDSGAELFAGKLSLFSSLRSLYLNGNQISTIGMKCISEKIPSCPTLLELKIEENLLADNEDIKTFLDTNKERVELFHNNVKNNLTEQYQIQLMHFPTLVNSRIIINTPLSYLINQENSIEQLKLFLSYNPTPYALYSGSKSILNACTSKTNREIIENYLKSYKFHEMKPSMAILTFESKNNSNQIQPEIMSPLSASRSGSDSSSSPPTERSKELPFNKQKYHSNIFLSPDKSSTNSSPISKNERIEKKSDEVRSRSKSFPLKKKQKNKDDFKEKKTHSSAFFSPMPKHSLKNTKNPIIESEKNKIPVKQETMMTLPINIPQEKMKNPCSQDQQEEKSTFSL